MSSDLPRPPFSEQEQSMPGSSRAMNPQPDHGETSYRGSGRLTGKKLSSRARTVGSAVRLRSRLHAKAQIFW
jgi:hypothetical protein